MDTLSSIFIISAVLNIVFSIIKWVETGETQLSAILGWACAILYCISSNL
jgi:hypothetical protein